MSQAGPHGKAGGRIILAAEMPGPRNQCSQYPVGTISKELDRELRDAAPLWSTVLKLYLNVNKSDADLQVIMQ